MRLFGKSYTDEEILTAIRNSKDEHVLEHLYKAVLPKVIHYIVSNSGSKEEAKDIFQDAVIRFYKAVKEDRFQEKCSISTFLQGISKNLYINSLRRRNKHIGAEPLQFMQDSVNLMEEILTEEKVQQVNSLLEQVGEGCKQLLQYSVYENMSMKEICEKMGYSNENVAKTYNYRCKKKLMDLIQQNPTQYEALKNEPRISTI